MDKEIANRKGQIALWVIVAAVIFVIILALFVVLRQRVPTASGNDEYDPEPYIEKCAKKAAEEAVEQMLPQGGFISPTNYKVYDNQKIEYLCQNTGNYKPCINQHPMLLNEMKGEIRKYVEPKVESCFETLKREMEKRNYGVNMGDMKMNISLGPNRIFIDIFREFALSKNDESQRMEEFKVEQVNPLYDLGLVAIEIAGQEAKYCYFEYVGYMVLFPRFDIKKTTMSDSTKIYAIEDKKSGKSLNIATRSCAIPPGV